MTLRRPFERRLSAWLALLGFVLTLAWPADTPAQPRDEPSKQALAHYKKGHELFSKKRYAEALEELGKSLELMPSPNTELIRAHALRELGRLEQAMAGYSSVVEDAADRVQQGESRYQPALEEAGRWMASLRPKLGELTIIVLNAPAGTTLTVNDEPLALEADPATGDLTATAWYAPSKATIVARTDEGEQQTEQVQVVAGREATVRLTLPAPSSEPGEPIEPVEQDNDNGAVYAPPVASWVALGVGVAGFAVFAGFGIASSSTAADLDECKPRCSSDLREAADEGERNQLIANIGLIAGVTGMATFGTIWLIGALTDDPAESDENDPDSVSLVLGPGQLGLAGRF